MNEKWVEIGEVMPGSVVRAKNINAFGNLTIIGFSKMPSPGILASFIDPRDGEVLFFRFSKKFPVEMVRLLPKL